MSIGLFHNYDCVSLPITIVLACENEMRFPYVSIPTVNNFADTHSEAKMDTINTNTEITISLQWGIMSAILALMTAGVRKGI